LPVDGGEGFGPAWDLVPKMKELASWIAEPAKRDASAPRCLGDIVLAVRRAGGGSRAVADEIAQLAVAQAQLLQMLQPCLSELLCDEKLRGRKWDPDDDDPCDGIFFARPLSMKKWNLAPWSKLDGSRLVQQGCTLIHADFEAIKAAENDYTTYSKRVGSAYEEIYPVADGFVRGVDDRQNPFSALKVFFRCDLPFPFTGYDCDLRILNRTDSQGFFASDIYSTSRDFLWMAGRDVFIPVRTSDGTWVGTLLVRLFGFDLRAVPDGDGDRQAGLRSSLGSLKRDSEAEFARSGGRPRTVEKTTPLFEVVGGKSRVK